MVAKAMESAPERYNAMNAQRVTPTPVDDSEAH